MAKLIDGRALSERLLEKMKTRIAALKTKPALAVLLVGDDPASHTYVGLKQKACENVGIEFNLSHYDADVNEDALLEKIEELNAREDITGILVQLPLPSQNADRIIAALDPKKDVDGFHRDNIEHLKRGEPGIAPATALGIMKLLEEPGETLEGKSAHIIASPLFAEPLEILLKERGISASVSSKPDDKTKNADIVIIAVGKPGLLQGNQIKADAVVIDVGTTKVDGKLQGDADASVSEAAGWLTPVPGGVGPMTVAMLVVNIAKAHQLQGKR